MKLNKQQIKALSDQIRNELNVEIQKENDIILLKSFKVFDNSKEGKAFKLLKDKFSDTNNYQFSDNAKKSLALSFTNSTLKSFLQSYNSPIDRDIILNTIECDNLDELIKKIKDKYKKV